MTNQFRSPSFIKIKHSLQSCILPTHLESCRQMMDNAMSTMSDNEMIILLEYYQTAHDLIYPIHSNEWNELVNISKSI